MAFAQLAVVGARRLVRRSPSAAGAYGAPAMAGALTCSRCLLCLAAALARPADQRARVSCAPSSPAGSFWNPSSIVDMKMWVLNGLALAGGYGYLAFGNVFCRDATLAGLDAALRRASRPPPGRRWTVLLLATLLELLAYELAYWFGHYLFHRIPALWEFHKVHHSAEAMTTFTELRQHPVEILAFMNLIAIATGAAFGAMTYAFGPGVRPFTLLNANIVLMLFLVSYGHLRHSAHVDPLHRPRRPDPAEPGASPDPPFRQPGALGQKPWLRAGGVGLGVRHALHLQGPSASRSVSASARPRARSATVPRDYFHAFRAFRRARCARAASIRPRSRRAPTPCGGDGERPFADKIAAISRGRRMVQDKYALVTGGGRGIGRAAALALAGRRLACGASPATSSPPLAKDGARDRGPWGGARWRPALATSPIPWR